MPLGSHVLSTLAHDVAHVCSICGDLPARSAGTSDGLGCHRLGFSPSCGSAHPSLSVLLYHLLPDSAVFDPLPSFSPSSLLLPLTGFPSFLGSPRRREHG